MIVMPIILGVWLARKYQVRWLLFLIGAGGFIASQILHIPFNQFLLNPLTESILGEEKTWGSVILVAVLFGLSAGVFEEVTRYTIYRLRTSMRNWEQGLMFGAGWGGVEAIIFGLLAASSIANVYIYQNGLLDSFMSAEQLALNPQAQETFNAQIEAVLGAPPLHMLVGALERVFALSLHLSFSILVLQAFLRHNLLWLFLAIGWHAAANTFAVVGLLRGWDLFMIEAPLAVCAAISLYIVWRLKPPSDPDVTTLAEQATLGS